MRRHSHVSSCSDRAKRRRSMPAFRGPDPNVLRRLAAKARALMLAEPGAVDVMDDWRQRVPLIRPIVAETPARNAGITRSEIAEALQSAFEGVEIGVYREDDKLLPIIARRPGKASAATSRTSAMSESGARLLVKPFQSVRW